MKTLCKNILLPIWQSSVGNFLRYYLYCIREEIFTVREKITRYSWLKEHFQERTGYELDLENPLSLNQKINWKKIFDRNPLLPVVADKYLVREYLKQILGEDNADKLLIPLLYVTENPATIPFDDLPGEYIIKANHGSRMNIIVERNTPVSRQQIITQCRDWLIRRYGQRKHEWAYKKIKPKIIIEELIRTESGEIPEEYKFHIMNGKCQFIEVNSGRYTHKRKSSFDRNWNFLDISDKTGKWDKGGFVQKPDNLDEMVELAENLGSPFDYIRVDLYSVNGRIFFGELTNYPQSGEYAFDPLSFDFELGSKWELKPDYWKKKLK